MPTKMQTPQQPKPLGGKMSARCQPRHLEVYRHDSTIPHSCTAEA